MRTQRNHQPLHSRPLVPGDENQNTSNMQNLPDKHSKLYQQFPYKIDRRSRPNTQREMAKPPAAEAPQADRNRVNLALERRQSSASDEKLKAQLSQEIADDYGADLLSTILEKLNTPKEFLSNHEIKHSLRAKMVDWMIEVLSSYQMTEDSFFKAVYFMDKFLEKVPHCQKTTDLHLIGVTTMFVATKYEEVHAFKLNTIFDKVAHRKLPKEAILGKQREILEMLDFTLERPTLYDLVKHLLFSINAKLSRNLANYLDKVVLYLAKMAVHHYELLLQLDYQALAVGCIYVGLKTLEQVDRSFVPEEYLCPLCLHSGLQEQDVLFAGSKMLALAKNFPRIYPSLENLKSSNGFCLNKSQ